MKVLVLAAIPFVAVIGPAQADMGVPNSGGPGVPVSGPPVPTHLKVFTVEPKDLDNKYFCDQGQIQSLSAMRVTDEVNVPVVFLDQAKNPIEVGTPRGFQLAPKPQGSKTSVRVTMVCGGYPP